MIRLGSRRIPTAKRHKGEGRTACSPFFPTPTNFSVILESEVIALVSSVYDTGRLGTYPGNYATVGHVTMAFPLCDATSKSTNTRLSITMRMPILFWCRPTTYIFNYPL
jgi:hypothetical protein